MFVFVGIKNRHLEVPKGYEVIKEGVVREGDMFAVQCGRPCWSDMEPDDIGQNVSLYNTVIRRVKS